MRFIKNLSYETQNLLKRFHKYSKKHEVRQRSFCILLSFKGYTINNLIEIFDVHLNTIYNWFDNWEENGILSLYTEKGQGRKPIINSENINIIKDLIKENPKQIKKVVANFKEKTNTLISGQTVKRFLKKN